MILTKPCNKCKGAMYPDEDEIVCINCGKRVFQAEKPVVPVPPTEVDIGRRTNYILFLLREYLDVTKPVGAIVRHLENEGVELPGIPSRQRDLVTRVMRERPELFIRVKLGYWRLR